MKRPLIGMTWAHPPLVAALLFFQACAPPEESSSSSNGGSTGTTEHMDGNLDDIEDVGPIASDLSCEENATTPEAPLFKLSTNQYRNTLRDLLRLYDLGDLVEGVDELLQRVPDDSLGDSFRRMDDRIAIEHVQTFFDVGVFVGDALIDDSSVLEKLAGNCASETDLSNDCWSDFQADFLSRAFRHPLTDAERDLFDELRSAESSGPEIVRAAVIVALSSPRFVYQVEVDGAPIQGRDDLLELDAYELAARLSYTFWQTMPDEELFEAAEDGSLSTEEGYRAQLKRVWEDPKAKDTIEDFWYEWLRLEKFTGFETSRPAFTALTEGENFGVDGHDYYADMVQEVLDLTELMVFEELGTLSDLLTTNVSVTQSSDLASLYAVEPWDGSSSYPTLANRSGLLQRAALLVSNLEQTNPFHRGALIRRSLLCGSLPQPDPNQLPPGSLDPPPVDEAQTTRSRFEAKVEGNGLCEGCHQSFSNIGYVLESFDAIGRYRTEERVFDEESGELLAELPIDTMAQANITSLDEDPVENVAELNDVIVQSKLVEACLAENYLAFVARRAKVKSSLDSCVIEDLAQALDDEEDGMVSAFVRIALLPTFFTRKVGAQ